MGVDISVVVESGDRQSAPTLYEWLRREDELRGRVGLERSPSRPGEMGDIANIITVAVGSGGLVSVFIGSLSTWLTHRRQETTVKVTFSDGRSIEVSSRGSADPDSLLRSVLDHTKEVG